MRRWGWRRNARFAAALPEALPLLVAAVAAGQPLPAAVASVADTARDPLRAEFRQALAATNENTALTDSLGAVADRYGSADLADVVRALRLDPALGADPARAVRAAEDLIRERHRLDGHTRTLSTAGRLAGAILVGGALVSGAAALILRDAQVTPFYTQPVGMALLAVAGLLVVIGGLWMDRLATVEV